MHTLLKLKDKVIILRKQEKTYTEIQKILGQIIPKSTLSYWCHHLKMSDKFKNKIDKENKNNLKQARVLAVRAIKNKRELYLSSIRQQSASLKQQLNDHKTAKLILTTLYACEGSKNRALLTFGNSDPLIVSLFMRLLRFCYSIDESKFRCTVQCRADQDTAELKKFWAKITNIPFTQFYKTQIDFRTLGKPSRKPNYKGVCRIDYFSADIFNELREIMTIIQ